MSIIEKALDKMGKDEPQTTPVENAVETPVVDNAAADAAIAEQLANDAASEPSSVEDGQIIHSGNRVNLDKQLLERNGILTPDKARSQQAEELRIIKRPLLVNAFGKGAQPLENGNLIMVTSALPGEGKTYTSINLAVSIAMEMDRTVLLVDADVAKPSVSRVLGLDVEYGLIDVLLDDSVTLQDALVRTDIPKLTVLPAGSHYHQSTELLASESMERLALELSQRYSDRVVIFDTPPLLAASQASVLCRLMGQVVMVVESERTPQHMVQEALTRLDRTEVVGLVLNKSGQKPGSEYGYGYGYYGQ